MSAKNKRRKKPAHKKTSAKKDKKQKTPADNPKLELNGLHDSKAYLTSMTADEILNLYKSKRLIIPLFQRKRGMWRNSQDQDLITTMIRGQPVLPFLVQYNTTDKKYYLLDGQQRLHNEMRFKNNEIKISKTYDPMLGGMKWDDLEPETQKKYNDYPIPLLVVVGGNGIGVQTYIRANSGLPINKAEKRRAIFHKTAFDRFVRKTANRLTNFYRDNRIISDNDILRCRDEEIVAENMILVAKGVTDGADLDANYEQYKTPKKLQQHILAKHPIETMGGYSLTIKAMFPDGLRDTGFDNPNNFYGLLGAVKEATIRSVLPNTDKDKKLVGNQLVQFLKEVREYSRTNKGTKSAMMYHKTIARGTRDFKNREDRIKILLDKISKN